MEPQELRSQADRFFSAFIVAFLFIYVGIVLQSRNSEQQVNLNRKARTHQEALIASITRQIEYKHTKDAFVRGTSHLDPLESLAGIPKLSGPAMIAMSYESLIGDPRRGSDEKTRKRLADVIQPSYDLVKEGVELDEKLAKASADLARLVAEAAKETSHSIPGIPVSVPESLILSLFPLMAFCGILRIWFYRRAFLHYVKEINDIPLWVGPIPLFQFAVPIWKSLSINFTILVIVGLVTTLTFDYLRPALGSDEPLKRSLARVYIVVGAFTLMTYLASLFHVIFIGEKHLPRDSSERSADITLGAQ